jgi:hypothetical protein
MILSAMEIMLLIDTLKGSLEIKNGYGRNFNFTDENRRNMLNYFLRVMNETMIEVKKEENIGG